MANSSLGNNVWRPGDVVSGEYKVVRCLGNGGMATVYLVRHLDLGHRAAAKVPYRHLVQCAEQRKIFSREVQTWISLPEHPHLVPCYYLRELDGLPMIFAEFVPSGSLECWIEQNRIRGLPHVLDLGIQLAEGMRLAEANGIVHRDLKPSNCFIDRAGRLKVGDFGLAASWESIATQESQLGIDDRLQWRFSAGTQSYCSPEQFCGAKVTTGTDIWSFAVTLYELITKRRPGVGPATPFAIKKFRALPEGRSVPSELWDFLLELLQPDLALRPNSFNIVSVRLRELYRTVAGQPYARKFPAIEKQTSPYQPAGEFNSPNHQGDPAGRQRQMKVEVLSKLASDQELAHDHRGRVDLGPEDDRQLCNSLRQIAHSHRQLGNLQEAITAFGECIDRLRILLRQKQDGTTALLLLTTLNDRAVCCRQLGDLSAAVADYGSCIELFGDQSQWQFGHDFSNLFAGIYQNRAMAHLKSLRYGEGLSDATKSIEIRERLVRSAGQKQYAIDLAGTYCNRAVVFRNVGDSKRALQDYQAAHALCMIPAASGQFTERDEVLSLVYMNLAALNLADGNAIAAKANSDDAIRLLDRQYRASGNTSVRLNLSNAFNNRANACNCIGDLSSAIADIKVCREIRQELVERDGLMNVVGPLTRAYSNEALFLLAAGRNSEAFESSNRGVSILQSMLQRNDRIDLRLDLAKTIMMRGASQASLGKYELAVNDLDAAAQAYRCLLNSGSADAITGILEVMQIYAKVITDVPKSEPLPKTTSDTQVAKQRQTFFAIVAEFANQLVALPVNVRSTPSLRNGLVSLRGCILQLQNLCRSDACAAAIKALDLATTATR